MTLRACHEGSVLMANGGKDVVLSEGIGKTSSIDHSHRVGFERKHRRGRQSMHGNVGALRDLEVCDAARRSFTCRERRGGR